MHFGRLFYSILSISLSISLFILWLTSYQINFFPVIADIIIFLFYRNHFNVALSGPELGIKNNLFGENTGILHFVF